MAVNNMTKIRESSLAIRPVMVSASRVSWGIRTYMNIDTVVIRKMPRIMRNRSHLDFSLCLKKVLEIRKILSKWVVRSPDQGLYLIGSIPILFTSRFCRLAYGSNE